MKRFLSNLAFLALCLFLIVFGARGFNPVYADAFTPTLDDSHSGTVSTASAAIVAAHPGRRYLLIQNLSSSANLGISITGTAAAIGTAKTMTLLPYGTAEFDGDSQITPSNGFNGIASTGTISYSVWEIF